MNARGLRSRPQVPVVHTGGAQTAGPTVGVLRFTPGRPGLGTVSTGLGLALCAAVGWSHVAGTTEAQQAVVLGLAIAYVLGVHAVVRHTESEATRLRAHARAAAANARHRASLCRAEERRGWVLVDRIVALENELHLVRHQAEQWAGSVLAHIVDLQQQLEPYETGEPFESYGSGEPYGSGETGKADEADEHDEPEGGSGGPDVRWMNDVFLPAAAAEHRD